MTSNCINTHALCRVIWRLFGVMIFTICHLGVPAAAYQPSGERTSEEQRQTALDWIDRYLSETVLFKRDDVEAYREKIKRMTPAEMGQRTEKTHDVRAILESKEWQTTDAWLKDFLKVQAIYSQEEIDAFQAEAASATSDDLIEMLKDIEQRHKQLIWMRSVSERKRTASLKRAVDAAKPSVSTSTPSRRATFGSTPSVNVRARYAGRGVPPPLINSRTVARKTVYREVFPRSYYGRW